MLLRFTCKNYKSYYEETDFLMMSAPKQTGLDYSLLKGQYKSMESRRKTTVKGLCSSVIYGPNAAGKTSLIGAMDAMRSIVLRGNIRNHVEAVTPNHAASILELIPNKALSKKEPVSFSVDFFEQGYRFRYGFVADLGLFLDKNHKRSILFEELYINDALVFRRDAQNTEENVLQVEPPEFLRKFYSHPIIEGFSHAHVIAMETMDPEELFLCNGFKLIFSQKLSTLITNWFAEKFMVIYRADSIQLINRFTDPQRKSVYVEQTVNEAAKLFGATSNAIGYAVGEKDTDPELSSIIVDAVSGKKVVIPAELLESYGTVRFVNIFPLVIRAMEIGATLVIDEFDASIHPMAIMNIVNLFHNDDINKNHAQLIFNTHNPIFLNSNLLRRDEIKFVERESQSNNSTLYSLSDFGTAGESGVRRNEDYMKNYFVSRYGAISDIDFAPLFENPSTDEGEV